jgi:hypothetical protein
MATIEVKRADGVKCPRCWNYHTVIGNPQDVCDRCLVIVTGMLDDLVRDGKCTAEDAEEWRQQVRAVRERWKAA